MEEESNNAIGGPGGESDVEFIIMNLYSKMKNLENKYIDLANFYKSELVKSNKKASGTAPDENRPLIISPRSPSQTQLGDPRGNYNELIRGSASESSLEGANSDRRHYGQQQKIH